MFNTHEDRLKNFHFGKINSQQRLNIERELLTDPEFLVDYLDLKRTLEGAEPVPQGPKYDFLESFRSASPRQKKLLVSVSMGALVAACLALLLSSLIYSAKPHPSPQGKTILIDSKSELSASSIVL